MNSKARNQSFWASNGEIRYATRNMLSAIRHTLSAKRYAIRYKPNAIRDTATNSYVRKNKTFYAKQSQIPKSQVNISDLLTREYGKMDTWSSGKNKANSKPIQTQFKANSNPIQTQFKPKQTQFQSQYMLRMRIKEKGLFGGFDCPTFSESIKGLLFLYVFGNLYSSKGEKMRKRQVNGIFCVTFLSNKAYYLMNWEQLRCSKGQENEKFFETS